MSVESGTESSGLAILFQIVGAVLVIGVAVVGAVLLFHVAAAVAGQLLPLVVIGAVVYVLLRLVMEAGSD